MVDYDRSECSSCECPWWPHLPPTLGAFLNLLFIDNNITMSDQSSFQASSTWLTDSVSPNTSSSSVNPLALLTRDRVLIPNHPSERAMAVTFCSRIDHVRIRETELIDGNTYYAIELFYKRTINNIPSAQRPSGLETLEMASPDQVKYQRFSVFVNLRHELNYHANVGHENRRCEFCANMTQLLNSGPTIPRLSLRLFHGQETVSEALEGFLNNVLTLVNNHLPSTPQFPLCDGKQEIPFLLESFLSGENEQVSAHQGHIQRDKTTRCSVG